MILRYFLILVFFKTTSTVSVSVDVTGSYNDVIIDPDMAPEKLVVNVTGSSNNIYIKDSCNFSICCDSNKDRYNVTGNNITTNGIISDGKNHSNGYKNFTDLTISDGNKNNADSINSGSNKNLPDGPNNDYKCHLSDQQPTDRIYSSCSEAIYYENKTAVFKIKVPGSDLEPFDAICSPAQKQASWTIIQRREGGDLDFFRNWTTYEMGFGSTDGEHFLGLKKIHALTNFEPYLLSIDLEDVDGNRYYARYGSFSIGDANQKYILKLDFKNGNSGDSGDSLKDNRLSKFSTFDSDNDESPDLNCAAEYKTGWWFKQCDPGHIQSNLNGQYSGDGDHGVVWQERRNNASLKFTRMSLRSECKFK